MLPFGIGFQEVLLILVVVLLVVGPQKLPELAKTLGKGLRAVRKAGDDLRDAIAVDDIKRSVYEEPKEAWRDAVKLTSVSDLTKEFEDDVKPVGEPYRAIAEAEGPIEDAEIEPVVGDVGDDEAAQAAVPASDAEPLEVVTAKPVARGDTVARGATPPDEPQGGDPDAAGNHEPKADV